jgi:hypothetical protein
MLTTSHNGDASLKYILAVHHTTSTSMVDTDKRESGHRGEEKKMVMDSVKRNERHTITCSGRNAKEGWWMKRNNLNVEVEEIVRFSPYGHESDKDLVCEVVNFRQPHYSGNETCQMCNDSLVESKRLTCSTYKKKNICKRCRSSKSAFLHLPTRWVFKYCQGCCRFENIAFFEKHTASSCEDKQEQKRQWARKRRCRDKADK